MMKALRDFWLSVAYFTAALGVPRLTAALTVIGLAAAHVYFWLVKVELIGYQPDPRGPRHDHVIMDEVAHSQVRYVVVPGKVRSANDGDYHYVSAVQLVRLYELHRGEWVMYGRHHGYHNLIPLTPRYDGKYGRPE